MTCKYQALTAATVDDHKNSDDLTVRLFGRNNMVEMELYQAETLMTETQKRIVNELLRRRGQVERVQIALGEGCEKQNTMRFGLSSGFLHHDFASITISPRGSVTGWVFDGPWKEREEGEPTKHEVECLADLAARYNDMGLYL